MLIFDGDIEGVITFLNNNSKFDINQILLYSTPLNLACYRGRKEIVSVLLAHPHIDVNKRNNAGYTALNVACWRGEVEVVKVLLRDSRVDINIPDNYGCTALWKASYCEHVEVIKWMIASGRELDLEMKGQFVDDDGKYSALDAAKDGNRVNVVSLLEKFAKTPKTTRHEICVEFGVNEACVADNFATVVFLCDGLLALKTDDAMANTNSFLKDDREKMAKAKQYFAISMRVPMELQMNIANKTKDDNSKELVLTKDSEGAFMSLAKYYKDREPPLSSLLKALDRFHSIFYGKDSK